MRFIVEGCDGTGKSTFAKKLAKNMGYTYVYFPRPDPITSAKSSVWVDEAYNYYHDYIIRLDNVVLDRSFLSTIVYAGLVDDQQEVIKTLKVPATFFIFTVNDDKEDAIGFMKVVKLAEEYHFSNVIRIDTTRKERTRKV